MTIEKKEVITTIHEVTDEELDNALYVSLYPYANAKWTEVYIDDARELVLLAYKNDYRLRSLNMIRDIKSERYNQGFYDGYEKATEQANACIKNLKEEIKHLHDWAFDREGVLKMIDKYTSRKDTNE